MPGVVVATVKCGGDIIKIIFPSSGTRALVKVEGIVSSSKHPLILAQSEQAYAEKLRMTWNFISQHDNDVDTFVSKSTKVLLQEPEPRHERVL